MRLCSKSAKLCGVAGIRCVRRCCNNCRVICVVRAFRMQAVVRRQAVPTLWSQPGDDPLCPRRSGNTTTPKVLTADLLAGVPKIFVFTSVYSVDRGIATIAGILEICEKHRTMSYIGKLRVVGICGPRGAGFAVREGLMQKYAIYVQPISYPTDPKGIEWLRFTPLPVHSIDDIEHLVRALKVLWKQCAISHAVAQVKFYLSIGT